MKIVSVLYPGEGHEGNPALLGCAENALGLPAMLENTEHEFVSLTDREGPEGLDEHLADAEVLITTPFWPVYVDRDKLDKAPSLKLILTAGVGSDHVDLDLAAERGITVAEVTASNVVSVAEHAVMQVLILVRNFITAYQQVIDGRWDIAEIADEGHDLEHKTVGIYGTGRIGQHIAQRLRAFDVTTLYYNPHRYSAVEEEVLGMRYALLEELQERCDVIVIAAPLTAQTRGLFDRDVLFGMKQGAYLVNIGRGAIVERDALVEALEQGHLGGYAGDVWEPEPAGPEHPWRTMPRHAMTPHISGSTLEGQARYAAGVRDMLAKHLAGEEIPDENIMA